ncbi:MULTISPECIES: TnsA endonuclease N-terminal domain-containing protein [unclassified Castellaniella]|uniref:TnsA endonuclease N-terminal domain-containing protein n=1 Tax=unclassified Castellaniella TaxID=2617606 RepID=UPI00262D2D91|nr:TnsA endonuclease N-terminal domain-containing protein [uncultured Castellaniella sp.]
MTLTMAGSNLDARTEKWIKQGRGAGVGKDYRPWLTVRDLPSSGRSHRVWGFQAQRTHHLLSDLELAAFFLFDWHPAVTDIREQYPLRMTDTVELAAKAGIRHPEVGGKLRVMSTDFLVDTSMPSLPRMAVQVKPSSDLLKHRVVEKLEIERRYWEMKGVPWYLLTEKQIPKAVAKNIEWLYPAQTPLGDIEGLLDVAPLYLNYFSQNPALRLSEAAMRLDQAYSLELGESLQKTRTLLAMRMVLFDIRRPWADLVVGDLHASSDIHALRDRCAANQ